MNDDFGGRWRWCRAWPRRAGVLAVTAGLVLLAAACGGGSSAGSGGSTQAAGSAQSPQLAFSRCMRSHGVANFPDPSSNGAFGGAGSGVQSNPHYGTAFSACRHLLPNGGSKVSQQNLSPFLRLAQCMRAHGVPNYPDPNANPNTNPNPNNTSDTNLGQAGIDPNSPQFHAAALTCERLLPQSSASPPQGGK